MPTLKKCPRCGAVAALDAASCARCGHAYRTQFRPPPAPTLVGADPLGDVAFADRRRRENRRAAIIVCIILACVAPCLIGGLLIHLGSVVGSGPTPLRRPGDGPLLVRLRWRYTGTGASQGDFENLSDRAIGPMRIDAYIAEPQSRGGFRAGSYQRDLYTEVSPAVVPAHGAAHFGIGGDYHLLQGLAVIEHGPNGDRAIPFESVVDPY